MSQKSDSNWFVNFAVKGKQVLKKSAKKRKLLAQSVYPWECISLIRKNLTTLDFVIKDSTPLMALIHIAYAHIHSEIDRKHKIRLESRDFMPVFQRLKFKIKISYSCWKNQKYLPDQILSSIGKTIEEKVQL